MPESVLITLNSTPLIHAPGMMNYAKTAYNTGDQEFAINLMDSLIGQTVTKEGQLQILKGCVPLMINGDTVKFEVARGWIVGTPTDRVVEIYKLNQYNCLASIAVTREPWMDETDFLSTCAERVTEWASSNGCAYDDLDWYVLE
jgi:hypothetical protein